jgi:tetratricopeptide (TPR) repeat protein
VENPAVTKFHRSLAIGRKYLAVVLSEMGKVAAAEAEYRTALTLMQKLAEDDPAVPELRSITTTLQFDLSNLLLQMGKSAQAEAMCRTALPVAQKLADDNPSVVNFRMRLAGVLETLGDVVRSMGRAAEAKQLYERAIALVEPEHVQGVPDSLFGVVRRHGLALYDLGDISGAAANFRRSLALSEEGTLLDVDFEKACSHGALAGLAARRESGVSAAEGGKEAASAMEWLRRAVAKGYRNANEIRIESALDPLRGREDFKKLLDKIEATAGKPAATAPMPGEKN